MKILDWKGYNWITQERWGQIHPEKSISWYDDTAVEIDDNGFLILKTQNNPKYFKKLDTTSPIGSGLVSCQNRFGYGYFSIEAILPKGPSLWPAFWMWAWESWPPEIDIFEGYSKHIMEYSVLWLPDKIEIHYNGKTVREITDPKILKQFQNIKMNVIINNFVMDDISLKNFKPSEFIITDFQHIPMEDLTGLKR
jgi:beta-glucanase (GH16 family)